MKKITYEIRMDGFDKEYNFYLDGEWFDDAYDVIYESSDGWAKVQVLKNLAEKGIIELEEIK